jgi:CBS-domain-containing membrane protein
LQVGEIGLGTQSSNLLVVKQWTDVIGVISFMYDNGLSGVPLVDEHARIVQNFSATDLLVGLISS